MFRLFGLLVARGVAQATVNMHQTTYTNLIGLLLFVGFAIGVNFLVYSQF
jgi:hypothetical protein